MKKTSIFVISSIVLLIWMLFGSCNKEKSLQERLQEERRAINRYIDRNNLVILNDYPRDGVFREKEFFRTSDGLYIHVVDSGNGKRAVPLRDEVTVRFGYRHDILASDTSIIRWGNLADQGQISPFSFRYGLPQTYTVSGSPFECAGWVIPLTYVGERAVVDLIIPSSLGSSNDNGMINPVFYKGLIYTNFY